MSPRPQERRGTCVARSGIALAIAWQVNDYSPAIPAMIVSFLVSLLFFAWGCMGYLERRTVLKEIRKSGQSQEEGEEGAGS